MIYVADNGPLRTITLARPDKANALTRQMLADIGAAFAPPPAIRCVVLTAQGTVFSAGADLDAARAGLATDTIWAEVSNRIAALPCLTIAALNGTVAGGAF
ncbi:MAG: enoyl-CoA hydratase/isomerase family protein, partial [Cypionkella sp.]